MEVSADRAGVLPGPREPVGPILSPLGRRERQRQLQMLPVPRVASMCPAGSQDLEGVGVTEFNNSTSGLGVTPSTGQGSLAYGSSQKLRQEVKAQLHCVESESELKPGEGKGLLRLTEFRSSSPDLKDHSDSGEPEVLCWERIQRQAEKLRK